MVGLDNDGLFPIVGLIYLLLCIDDDDDVGNKNAKFQQLHSP